MMLSRRMASEDDGIIAPHQLGVVPAFRRCSLKEDKKSGLCQFVEITLLSCKEWLDMYVLN